MDITVLFGTNDIVVSQENPTIQSVMNSGAVQSMGVGDNYEVKRDGETLSQYSSLYNGDILTISQKASQKA